jgi:AraC-like DNA-binding protein
MSGGKHTLDAEAILLSDNAEKYYLLGVAAPCLSIHHRKPALVTFRSKHYELISNVKEILRLPHTIISENRTKSGGVRKQSHSISFKNERIYNYFLEVLGFDKLYRPYQEVSTQYEPDFIRGFYDGQGRLNIKYRGAALLRLEFNSGFISSLESRLNAKGIYGKNTEVPIESRSNGQSRLDLSNNDAVKFRDYIYQGLDIRCSTPYLKSKHGAFECISHRDPTQPGRNKALGKIERAKILLDRNVPTIQIISQIGYSHQENLYTAFKKYTGMTVNEYRNSKIGLMTHEE